MKIIEKFAIIIILALMSSCAYQSSQENYSDSDTIAVEVSDVEVSNTHPYKEYIRMKDDFNPTYKITKSIENKSLKELFFQKFVDLAIKACVHPEVKRQVLNSGAIQNGYLDLTKVGPIDYVDLENIMGTLGSSSPSRYFTELHLDRIDDRQCQVIPINSNLAKAYLLQDVRGFCKDNYKLAENWCKEMDNIKKTKRKERIKNNQQKYLQ